MASAIEGAKVEDQPPEESLMPLINNEREGEGTTTTTIGTHPSPFKVPEVVTGGGVDVVLLESKEKSIELVGKGGRGLTATEEGSQVKDRSRLA